MKKNTKRTLIKSSIISVLALASISPAVIALSKNAIEDYQNKLFNNMSRQAQNWDQFPNIHTATKEMFHNTEGVVPLSSIGRGQMVTPWGWLGTYSKQVPKNPGGTYTNAVSNEQDYWNNTLVLVGWDGSIIWTSDESQIAIYSAQYNFKNDTIFVVRTQDPSGAGGHDANLRPTAEDNISYKVTLTIHDAKTGKILYDGEKISGSSWNFKSIFDDNRFHWDQWNKKDLYYQDMVTFGNGDILWFWIPNMNKLQNDALTLNDYMRLLTGNRSSINNNADLNKNYYKVLIIKKSEIEKVRNGEAGAAITPVDWVSQNLNNNNIFHSSYKAYSILFQPLFFVQDNFLNSVFYCMNTADGSAWRTCALWTYDPITNNLSLAKTTPWGLNFNVVDNLNFSMFKKNDWNSQYYNEKSLLLPTRNMFDQNIITIAYPAYANIDTTKNVKLPIFNVLQAHGTNLNDTKANSKINGPKHKQFNFGTTIYKNYLEKNLQNTDPFSSSTSSQLKWYPWPGAISSSITDAFQFDGYTEQLYSRLISVSPFDNTIVYASRPNKIENTVNNNKDQFSGLFEAEKNYASFWIGNGNTGNVTNMIIPDSSASPYNGNISQGIITAQNQVQKTGGIWDIYKNGFWFDINSLTGQANKLNLYFKTTGSMKDSTVAGLPPYVKSTPIAFVSPEVSSSIQMNNLISPVNNMNKVQILNNSYTNYITSRADLNLWFPRTYQHLTKGVNFYQNNEVLNNYDTSTIWRAVATNYGSVLSNSNFGSNKNSVELFSLWSTGTFDKAAVKRAEIVADINPSQTATTALNVKLKFKLENNNWTNPFYTDAAGIARIKTLEYPVTIEHAGAWQLLDAWSTNMKLNSFSQPNNTNNFDTQIKIVDNQPVQGTYGGTLGTHNLGYWTRSGSGNNYTYTWNGVTGSLLNNNTDTPLWVEFGIDYNPNNNADATWIRNLESFENGLFKKTYPAGSTLPSGAISFNTVLAKFVKWKAENLMYGTDVNNPTNNIYSPGQVCIKSYLKLNPYFKKNNTIQFYSLTNNVEVMYDSTNNVCYAYENSQTNSNTVYKQTSPEWDRNNQYGFGSQITNDISNSWINIPTQQLFVSNLPSDTKIKDTLVRDGNIKTDQMFSAKYASDGSSIVLTIKDNYVDWVKKRFSSFNQMMGRYVKFQYLVVSDSNVSQSWQDFNSIVLTDANAKNIFDSKNSYTIPFVGQNGASLPNNIQKVRFVLYSLPTNDASFNPNKIISSSDLSGNAEFVSDAITLDQIPLHVDYNWLNDVELTISAADKFLNGPTNKTIDKNLLTTALNTYETQVLNNSTGIDSFKNLLKLTYSLDKTTYVNADGVYDLLKNKWEAYTDPNLGIINLYDNRNNTNLEAIKIYVKFEVKNASDADKYDILVKNPNLDYINRTNIKFFINLNPYKIVLETSKTSVQRGTTENSIANFIPPTMTGNVGAGFLFGKTFDEITKVLAKFGITVEYQKNDGSQAWTSDKKEITSYNPDTREIKMRFKVDSTSNPNINVVASIDGTNVFNQTSSEISLKLNVPILIKLDTNVKNNFIRKENMITGNNWEIKFNTQYADSIINDIQSDGKNNATSADDKATWDQLKTYLEVQYALSNTKPDASTIFYSRDNLITHLKAQTDTNYNNVIWARLHLKTVQGETEPKFILDSSANEIFKLNNSELSNVKHDNNKIKIYVQAAKYETALNQISAIGSTGKLQLTYPQLIQDVINQVPTSAGIKVQYSLKQDITYDSTLEGDINTGWVDNAPTQVPIGTNSIKIRIIVTDANVYEYGMGNEQGTPSVHSVDLTNISSLIDVDKAWFNEVALTVAATGNYLKDIKESDINTWKENILNKSAALQTDPSLKGKVEIKFKIEGNDNWFDTAGLVTQINSMINDYAGTNLGIIYLWDGTRGLKINAKFEKKNSSDNIVFVPDKDSITANTDLEGEVKTDQIKTYVDLSSYVSVLTTSKTAVVLRDGTVGTIQTFTPPAMSNTVGSGFLNGKTFDEIATRLQELGITFKFNNGLDTVWNTKENVTTYNTTNPILHLGFEYNSTKVPGITIKVKNNNEITGTKLEQNFVTLKLQAPVAVTVDLNQLTQLALKGNTKQISNVNDINTKITTIIQAVTKQLDDNGIEHNDLKLEIRFSLKGLTLEDTITDPAKTEDGIWFTFDKFNQILSNSTTNYNTNAVYAKFYIKDNPKLDGVDKYILSNTNYQTINAENLTTKSEFQVYINNTIETQDPWITENLKLTGSQENFNITNLNSWLSTIPKGLEVEYNAKVSAADATKPDDAQWQTSYNAASPIDSMRNYWIRFKVKEAYVFEGALNSTQYSKAFKLDASQIQVALKVQSEWLNQITLTGNLKNLTINEDAAIKAVTDASMMPVSNIIRIEYSYDDTNWYYKDTFITNLSNADGAKDSTNWIILREDIKARFVLDPNVNNKEPKYLLEVDKTNINEDNSNNISKQLITASQNIAVKGYINLDKFTSYKASNFSVSGTDTEANLNIKQVNELNNLLTPYSSTSLFSILYKSNKTANYEEANKVWTPGQPLTTPQRLNGNYSARYFAMQFKVTSNDYDLYKGGTQQANNAFEYSTDATDNANKIDIKISVAIENPLSANEIATKFLEANNTPQWYNGEGAFKIQITKSLGNGQGSQIFNTFKDFLDQWASKTLPQDQRDALELVYYISNDSNEEIKQKAIEDLSIYNETSSDKYNVWKAVSDQTAANQLNYHLKVNDYVMLAVRIKKEKLSSESNPNGYVLKNGNHSPTDLIRAFGYKVHTDNIDVDWATLKVRNVDAAESASYGLDGYAMLDQISLKRSATATNSDDYLNVSLQLNYFTEFYYDSQDQVLVSADGSRLVKRDAADAEQDGNYKDANGQDITDKQGQTIPILYKKGQKENGILAKPTKASTLQRSHELIETISNAYTLELNNGESNALYSFFKFQDIEIQFTNKKGLSDPNEPGVFDYYVDNSNVTKPYTIDTQIKFPIENNKLVRYTFNSEEFISYIKEPNNIKAVYENTTAPEKNPINGQSKIKYMYKVFRQQGSETTQTELTTIEAIQNQIKTDFGNKVILKTTYTPINGSTQDIPSNDLSSITSLSNGDRFRIEIVSSDENNLIFAQQPSPLVFTVSGLYEADIDEEYLQYLRVQQNGNFNGEGQFEIFVDNPYDDKDDHLSLTSLLQGYKFMVRVWNSEKAIKQDWTTDFESINNLRNGDKVEWKLVAPTGSPVEKAYYNTVANMNQHDTNNKVYSFSQVAKIGNVSTVVVADGIGQSPTTDIYPENSGLLISGLADKISDTYTTITEEEFIHLMNVMNFGYTGINGLGNMVSERDINTIIVNTSGLTCQEYTMKYLVDQGYLTFFSNDIEFTWNQVKDNNGNWLTSPGTLSNGDQIKIKYQDPTMSSAYVWEAPEVSGLKDKSDSMSLLAYVGIGLASFTTLGIFALVYFRARNKKLRVKK